MSIAITVNETTPLAPKPKKKKEKEIIWSRAVPVCLAATIIAGLSLASGKISLPGLAALEIAEKTLKTITKRSHILAGTIACAGLLGTAFLTDRYLGTNLTPAALKISIVTIAGGGIKKFILAKEAKESKPPINV